MFRFEGTMANEVALLVLLLLPVPVVVLLVCRLNGWRLAVTLAVLLPLFAFNTCTAFFIGGFVLPMDADAPTDLSLVVLQRLTVGGSDVVLYRTNCGATCSFGLEARQERALIPHRFNLVRVIAHWYPASEGALEATGPQRVRINVAAAREDGAPPSIEYTVRRWVYF